MKCLRIVDCMHDCQPILVFSLYFSAILFRLLTLNFVKQSSENQGRKITGTNTYIDILLNRHDFSSFNTGSGKGSADPAFLLLSPANTRPELPSLLSSVIIVFFATHASRDKFWRIFRFPGSSQIPYPVNVSRIPHCIFTVFCSIPGSREYTPPVKSTQQCQTIARAHLSLTSKLSCKIRAFSSATSLNFVFDSIGTFSVRWSRLMAPNAAMAAAANLMKKMKRFQVG